MASRQNREARSEYPTGHNKGNDSPSRAVPRTNGGQTETADEERARLLGTEATPEDRRALIDEHISKGIDETGARDRAEQEADTRRSISAEDNPTGDLTAVGAAKKIRERHLKNEEADR